MLYSLSGKLTIKKPSFLVLETAGMGFKVLISSRTFRQMPKINSRIKIFCFVHNYQNGADLYGFLSEKELEIFELLNSISGVGPKAGLKILNEMRPESLLAAISRGRSDLLTKTAGVGQKKANRIILELADKIKKQKSEAEIGQMEFEFDLEEILKSLGYKQNQIREVIRKIPIKAKTIQEKIKFALKFLSGK